MKGHNPADIGIAYVQAAFAVFALFYGFSFFYFALFFFCYFGSNSNMFDMLGLFLFNMIKNPEEIFDAYGICFKLMEDCHPLDFINLCLIFAILILLFGLCAVLLWNYITKLSYQKVFASEKEIERVRLFEGDFHFLGSAYRRPLRLPFNNSVLAFTQDSNLKTTSIALPSIFSNDDCNIVAIDTTGNFQKFSLGYRATLGKTLCYNWKDEDDKIKRNFLASWNPLAAKCMPETEDKKKKYIVNLATSILSTNGPCDDITVAYLQGIISFFMEKTERAVANDYFLNILLRGSELEEDDHNSLMSYYVFMPDEVAQEAINLLKDYKLNAQNYLPIGSWENIAENWQGKELSMPMIYDSLLQSYANSNSWSQIFSQYAAEAELFNYSSHLKNILSSLTKKDITNESPRFMQIADALAIFQNQTIREKTIYSDFSYDEIRGLTVDDTVYPMSLYLSARTPEEKNMSKIMLNMLIMETLENYSNQTPIVFVLDDLENLGYIHSLSAGISFGEKANISFLALCSNLDTFKQNYGYEKVSDILSGINYILVSAKTSEREKYLLSEVATAKTRLYMDDIFFAIDKLPITKENQAILILNWENPMFVRDRLVSALETKGFLEESIIQSTPYIDDFTRDRRPPFSENAIIPVFPAELMRKIKKAADNSATPPQEDPKILDWWLADDAFNNKIIADTPAKTDKE